jgi:Tol biopolymer transport system component
MALAVELARLRHRWHSVLGVAAVAVVGTGMVTWWGVPANAESPPETGWIAYESAPTALEADRDIWMTDESGTRTTRLTVNPTADLFPQVAPNGKEIAFASTRNTEEFPNPSQRAEIYVMDLHDDDGDGQGDDLRRLTDHPASDIDPAWSPDGKRIAFTSNRANPASPRPLDIYVMTADGSEPPVRLPHVENTTEVQHPDFSPDGEWIVYGVGFGRSVTDFDLFMTRVDGTDTVRLTDTPIWGETHPAFSPDGTRLAFVSNRDPGGDPTKVAADNDVFVMRAAPEDAPGADPNVPVNLTDAWRDAASGVVTNERWPSWSPDSKRIALWSGLGQGLSPAQRSAIWVVDAVGSEVPLRLTDPTVNAVAIRPDWGPPPQTPRKLVGPSTRLRVSE